jgi:hypothetical protein
MVILGKTCRLCLRCETLVAHKWEIDRLLSTVVTVPTLDYLVLGTSDRLTYRRGLTGAASIDEVKAHTSDFKSYWNVEITPNCRTRRAAQGHPACSRPRPTES